MLNDIDMIKDRLKGSEGLLSELDEIKAIKDKEIEKWRESLEDIQKRFNFIDKKLFESKV